jgi:hypothetical protein
VKDFLILLLSALIFIPTGFILNKNYPDLLNTDLKSPFSNKQKSEKVLPYLKYSINNLKNYPYKASEIKINKLIKEYSSYSAHIFSFKTTDKTMTGQINLPDNCQQPKAQCLVLILLRGYVDPDIYYTGLGTRNAAAAFAEKGYITLAPDFFGYAESDAASEDNWEARFIKPINVIELIKTVRNNPEISLNSTSHIPNSTSYILDPNQLGLWAHSNGGQIAISVLEILSKPLPTTLWAPVLAPFPYSIMFFSDEAEDEGKAMRFMVSKLESEYDVFDFSISQHLDKLTGPIQIHHGASDKAALISWTEEFIKKLDDDLPAQARMTTRQDDTKLLDPVDLTFFKYPNTDHNLLPNWQTAINRDLEFFSKNLK